MDGREFINSYSYMYNPNHMYMQDPNMQQQPAYYNPDHGQQQYADWGWQPQGFNPSQQQMPPAFYGGYPQPNVNFEYGYGTPDGTVYNQQGFQGFEGNQENTGKRSKYSYSQNRIRNRTRPDQRQFDVNDSNDNSNNNAQVTQNQNNNAEGDDTQVSNGADLAQNISSNAGPETSQLQTKNRTDVDASKPHERWKNRGSRFQGMDSRTKQYDKEKQQNDRQKAYNKTFFPERDKKEMNEKVGENSNEAAGASQNGKGARPKSYKDTRGNGNKDNYRNNKDRGTAHSKDTGSKPSENGARDRHQKGEHSQGGGRSGGRNQGGHSIDKDVGKDMNHLVGRKEEGVSGDNNNTPAAANTGRDGSSRKKKKDYQQVYSSASSPREWQGKPSPYASQREQYDRYNYRGQDYNKRHKEPSSNMERGGDRTKLSTNFGDENTEAGSRDDDAGDLLRADTGSKKRSGGNTGPLRGSRNRKNQASDESQRGVLIEQLSRGTYECMVCCETVRVQTAIWSCGNCYHVFHLYCIKKWARSPNAVVSGTEKDGWRCPACQNLSFKFPNQYRCFCGKVRDPETTRMDTPHSCGDVCQKERPDGCKHPCNILCHPGPCPECNATVTKACDCGKTKQTAKCSQSMTLKCEQICERQLNCGRHFCKDKCHNGQCKKCEETLNQECFGKHENRDVLCGSEESFSDSYSCKTICSKSLDCGVHTCDKACHSADCDTCPTLPKNVLHCPCGARSLLELGAPPRTSCTDPIATCDAICNKVLDCGPPESKHRCDKVCHEGPCGPCNGMTTLTCKCLSMDKQFKCSDIDAETGKDHVFLCDRRCNRKKACGRHKCGQPCCVKEEHPCELVCARKLPCGLHKCTEPCHKNNCPPCLMAGFDELTCHCGAEVMYPPIPCGTLPPECHKPCTRQHACNHPVRHNCHSDEKCPPCVELTKKMCMGNHVMRSNIACHLTDISCGMKCSKALPCGEHTCIKTCHKGACLEEGQSCSQPCQRRRELCEHVCGAPCHGETPCPQTSCKAKVLMKCSCGNREAETYCSTGGLNTDNSDYHKLTMQSLKDSIQGIMGASSSVNIAKFNPARLGQSRVLDCSEECALLERNKRLALALQISNPDLSAKLGNPSFSEFLKEFAKKEPSFVAGIEKNFGDLVQSAKQSKQPSRSHVFPSMNMNQRRVVHELAEFYGCQTQSYDYEPKKNVVATAMRDKCWLPSTTLTSLVQRELHPRAPPPIPHIHKEEALRMTNLASKQSTLLLGERGKSGSPTPEGWHVIGKKTKKCGGATGSNANKSAIATIDRFEANLADICATGSINYDSLTNESKQALKCEPVVDYFDFTVN